MSVSSRSPTKIGCVAPSRCTVSSSSGRYGLPATSGSAFTAIRTAATAAPLPGTMPRSVGRVGSVLVATQWAPRWMAIAASLRSSQVSSAPQPWITATGSSSAERTPISPCSSSASQTPAPPTASTGAPGPKRAHEQVGGGLSRGHHVGPRGFDAELGEVLGDHLGRSIGVVGDEADPDVPVAQLRDPLGGSGHRHRPEIDHAVEIEQRGVVGVDEGCGRHRRESSDPQRSGSSESSSKADSSKIDDHAVEFVAPDRSVGLTVGVQLGGRGEPLPCGSLVPVPEQGVGVRVLQPRHRTRVSRSARTGGVRRLLEDPQGLGRLAEIGPGARPPR